MSKQPKQPMWPSELVTKNIPLESLTPEEREARQKAWSEGEGDYQGEPKQQLSEAAAKIYREAGMLAPGDTGLLAWVDKRVVQAGGYMMPEVLLSNFAAFDDSRKTVFGLFGGLRTGKTVACCRAIMVPALLKKHQLEPRQVGVVPIISATGALATDSLGLIEGNLLALGVEPERGESFGAVEGGLGGTYVLRRTSGGGGMIDCVTAWGQRVQFRCMSPTIRSSVGYTLVAGFLDEIDVWFQGEKFANSAGSIIQGVLQRATTTMGTARIYMTSAHYPDIEAKRGEKGAFRAMVEAGDTDMVYIARIGVKGTELDYEQRELLAKHLIEDHKQDPKTTAERLLVKTAPSSPGIPAWATNPHAKILNCYNICQGNIPKLLAEYGAQYDACGSGGFGWTPEDLAVYRSWHASRSGPMTADGMPAQGGTNNLQRFPGLPSTDPRSTEHGGRGGHGWGSFTI